MDILQTLAKEISNAIGREFTVESRQHQAGGSINQALKISSGNQHYFVKLNQPQLSQMFMAETEGLKELASSGKIHVPEVICTGANQEYAWLVLQYLELGPGNRQSFRAAGLALANMHKTIHEQFGWKRDNTIGSTPQINDYTNSWDEFWKNHRLGYQLKLAIRNGYSGSVIENVEKLIQESGRFFNHTPVASLLHGDLWSGNLAFDRSGLPCIYDPAVYYGDRETDIAMTELFGGFSNDFYAAYNEVFPLDSNYKIRRNLYNLYHILNHMNMFGGGYHGQAVSMSARLLSELQ